MLSLLLASVDGSSGRCWRETCHPEGKVHKDAHVFDCSVKAIIGLAEQLFGIEAEVSDDSHTLFVKPLLKLESLKFGVVWFLKVLPFVGIIYLPCFVSRSIWGWAEKQVEKKEGRKVKRPSNIEFDGDKENRG